MAARPRPPRIMVRRHPLVVRIAHWVNVAVLALLLMSGLQIFNAHPALYWGQASTFSRPWVSIRMAEVGGEPRGITTVAGTSYDTTGVLGWSGREGAREKRAFPAWATLPSYKSLAEGRRWHFFLAWIFVVNGLIYLAWGILRGHIAKDLWPTRAQLSPSHVWREIVGHARLRFPKGEAARVYNVLQKASYLSMVLVVLPLIVLTGLCMSPGFNATVPWLIDLFGGRQSARTIHFLSAGATVLFTLLHVAMVLASGAWNNLRSMITGRYAIEVEEVRP